MSGELLTIVRQFALARWRFTHLQGEALEHFQNRRAQAVLHYALQNAPFYHQYFHHYWKESIGENSGKQLPGVETSEGPIDWKTLPPIDKSAMMTHFDTFNTVGIRREQALALAHRAEQERDFAPTLHDITVGLSSGTSGQRGLFLVNRWEQAAWAGTLLARALPPWRSKGYHVALFLRSNSNLYERVHNRFIAFRYFDLMTPLEEILQGLNGYQPDILVGPPSLLVLLADCQRAGGLQIKPVKVISVAEVLESADRLELETIFGVPVGEIYQATEGLIGVTCGYGSLHLQEDVVAVQTETIDPLQPTYVTPILTDLWRTTQPILRYRLDDIWIMEETPCRCGSAFRILKQIIGRRADIFYFPSLTPSAPPRFVFADKIQSILFYNIDKAIPEYQVFQDQPGCLRVHLALATPDFEQCASAMQTRVPYWLQKHDCHCEHLVIEQGIEKLPRNVKRQRIRNLTLNKSN